ncbi:MULTISPECIES: sulfite exporter TauE/SafE family protein [Pseudovibrio]|uniref:sulfite exporter TauE/SafE family protein n=1 Tax=Stappiaceae TaxID=2821832 RepID=UPI00236557C2|nr:MULTISPECIES: sulfite exporter TauE/SafE family protein [Pseudovibrio]MDD7911125.1 sulfite exporter TauE/SafE family protein [Pseudovibrio exalbescens]MDX5593188.1 sulfite exporter TauE/SafE family protein [Pseudovibrio sp. SPO723]
MQIYLPIAEIPINMFMIFGMGGAVGFLSGLFGIGGGFLLTPLLIFSGIPPAVAVATVTTQTVASSSSGVLAYIRRNAIDFKLAFVLLCAGIVGSFIGVWLFGVLQELGQLDLVISLAYVTFLGAIGILMLVESMKAISRKRTGGQAELRRPGQHNWVHGLPFKMRFRRSKIYVSVIPIFVIGSTIGFLGSILGLGGGFMMVPALIYLLRVPTNVVIGTSLLQILVTMAVATILHSINTQTVDVVLALTLMVGSVIGAQFGAQIGQGIRGEHLRLMLALLVLSVGLRFAFNLIVEPSDLYSVTIDMRLPQ